MELFEKGCIPEDWKSSVVLPIYKGKADPMDCGSYRGIKLLEHAMKWWKESSKTDFGRISTWMICSLDL